MQRLEVRTLTDDERRALERLAHSRTAPARAVERARIVWQAHTGATAGEIAAGRRVDPETLRRWLKRFNAQGVAGLEDRPPSRRLSAKRWYCHTACAMSSAGKWWRWWWPARSGSGSATREAS